MNIREFCSEPGYRSALVLTWSFDAVFFERVVLRDLRQGGAGTIAVLADRRETESAISRWLSAAQHLGRRYVLDTATVPGHFHPKVILRMGRSGAYVCVGTGNVTAAGWGVNQELAEAWRVGPGQADTGSWVRPFLDEIAAWVENPLVSETVAEVGKEQWLSDTASGEGGRLIWSSPRATLAAQLGQRWAGRRFTDLSLITGSTDKAGAFLKWAHRSFGVQTATVVVNAQSASFDPSALESLPVRVEFIEPSGVKPMHAKCYWFDGPDGPAAVMGSPNCSASAWERPVDGGGNVETAVVFDEPDREAWRSVLTAFEGPRVGVRDHLRGRADSPEQVSLPAGRFRLRGVQLDIDTGQIEAQIVPAPAPGARVTLLVDRDELPLTRRPDQFWAGPRPEDPSVARALFAAVKVVDDSGTWVTARRWIDQPRDLRDAARDPGIPIVFERFEHEGDPSQQRRVLEDLQLAMDAVLSDRAGFPDIRRRGSKSPDGSDEGVPASRLDPNRVAVALRDVGEHVAELGGATTSAPLSVTGVLRVLFPPEDEEVQEGENADLDSDEGQTASKPDNKPLPPPRRPPAAPLKKRLVAQMDGFLTRLRDRKFADTCTATQLVQATAFPMGLAVLGVGSGWVDQATAQRWTISSVAALLHEPIADGPPGQGLLSYVAARYAAEGREDVFQQVVGDGLLWAVAATVLAGVEWEGVRGRVLRALLLRDVFRRGELCACVEPAALRTTAARFRHGDAVRTMTDELPGTDASLGVLETWLATNFARLIESQESSGLAHAIGDPLWRASVGWVFAAKAATISANARVAVLPWRPGQFSTKSDSPRVLAAGFYVNVRLALSTATLDAPSLP